MRERQVTEALLARLCAFSEPKPTNCERQAYSDSIDQGNRSSYSRRTKGVLHDVLPTDCSSLELRMHFYIPRQPTLTVRQESREFTSCISIQPIESSHQPKPLNEARRDRQAHPSNLLIHTPSVQQCTEGQNDKDPRQAAIQSILGEAHTVAASLVAHHAAVGEVACHDAAG